MIRSVFKLIWSSFVRQSVGDPIYQYYRSVGSLQLFNRHVFPNLNIPHESTPLIPGSCGKSVYHILLKTNWNQYLEEPIMQWKHGTLYIAEQEIHIGTPFTWIVSKIKAIFSFNIVSSYY